jgi:hypothetical protein
MYIYKHILFCVYFETNEIEISETVSVYNFFVRVSSFVVLLFEFFTKRKKKTINNSIYEVFFYIIHTTRKEKQLLDVVNKQRIFLK